MARGQTMKAIEEAITRLEAERSAFNARIDGRIEGLREALRLQSGSTHDPNPNNVIMGIRKRGRRGDLKETVLDLAQDAAEKGLTAEECVALAKSMKGVDLVQNSVSSLLSRLKNNGIMFFDGQRYRLKQYAGPRHAA